MIAVEFPEANIILNKPNTMTEEQCMPAYGWQGKDKEGNPVIITCWQLNKEDLEEINKTGKIYAYVLGKTTPPISLETKNPFLP